MRSALFDTLAEDHGIVFHDDVEGFYGNELDDKGALRNRVVKNFNFAADAQPGLVTTSNAGIPAYLSTWIDPEMIRTVLQPLAVAQIWGERQTGNWLTDQIMFTQIETVGYTSAYGDFSQDGMTDANVDFPYRQTFHYQTWTKWGEKELEKYGLARISYATELNTSSALILNQYQNKTYAFGVAGLQLYGTLTDPNLSAYVTPVTKVAGGTSWTNATPNEIVQDIQKLYAQLQTQAPGVWDENQQFTLVIPPQISPYLGNQNSFGLIARAQVLAFLPNLRIVQVPQYATPAGNVIQLIATKVNGQDTGYCAYTDKLRLHKLETYSSYFQQKKSQGTAGCIIRYPLAVAQLIGV